MRKPTKDARLRAAKAAISKTLDRTGYTAQKARHGRVRLHTMPDLATGDHRQRYPSVGGFGPVKGPATAPDGAMQFPVGNFHKQGLQLVSLTDLEFAGGKKP